MQTFMPYVSFVETARVLDSRRLGKQRVETLQIMNALIDPEYGWQNHPAVNMWRNYEKLLLLYQEVICFEWLRRGGRDTCYVKTANLYYREFPYPANVREPWWMGDPDFHLSHQSNLIRKDPKHYGPLFPGVPNDLPYVWPV